MPSPPHPGSAGPLAGEQVSGMGWVEQMRILQFRKRKNLTAVDRPVQGLRKLLFGRTNLFIYPKVGINAPLNSEEFRNTNLFQAGTMAVERAHAYLHKKNKSLVPELEKVLKEMKSKGLILQYKATGARG